MPHDPRRRQALLGLGALVATTALVAPSAPARSEQAAAQPRRAVELTFLRANPGDRERLRRFVVLNWFAMDAIAKTRGLIDAYTVMDTGRDDGDWQLLVAVTYRDERGYEGIATEFERIRREHRTVPVDGRTLRELGTIVKSQRVYEYVADASGIATS